MSNSSALGFAARKLLPILDWIPAYRREWLLPDVLAGVALWAVMVPEGMAYAGIVGVPLGHVGEALKASLDARLNVNRVLLDFSQVNFIDSTASDEFLRLINELKNRGFTLAFARVRDAVRDDMRLAGIEAIVGPRNFYERLTDGVRAGSSKDRLVP